MKIFWSDNYTKAFTMDDELFDILLVTGVIMTNDNNTYIITNNYNTRHTLVDYIHLLTALKKYYVLTHQVKSLLTTLKTVDQLVYVNENTIKVSTEIYNVFVGKLRQGDEND